MSTVPYYYESMPINHQSPAIGGGNDYGFALSQYGGINGQVSQPVGGSFDPDMNVNGVWDRRLGSMLPSQSRDPNTGAVTNNMGWGMPALSVAQGAFNAWMGMKQYGLAKAQLAESKQQFNLNYDAQRRTTNAQLRDRQMARVASNPGAYQSVGEYMTLNGIGGR